MNRVVTTQDAVWWAICGVAGFLNGTLCAAFLDGPMDIIVAGLMILPIVVVGNLLANRLVR